MSMTKSSCLSQTLGVYHSLLGHLKTEISSLTDKTVQKEYWQALLDCYFKLKQFATLVLVSLSLTLQSLIVNMMGLAAQGEFHRSSDITTIRHLSILLNQLLPAQNPSDSPQRKS
ncbi:hypothetical protein BT69DRAFT_1295242 [Atractiella rhizophila]|nr:hypothetical protein BT69DRAFT_1295242 [Atractiella rhizophila]